tara:strand:+ start:86 stop:1228 length:1143 start_codon:yes stop_codon:yes gene_type:complete
MLKTKFIVFLLFSFSVNCQELYYPGLDWEQREPESLGFSNEKIKEAIQFAVENENSVNRNLKDAIISSFGYEPGFEIKGPTKPRKGPNGLIIKDGYIIGKWGDVSRVDMTFSVTKSYLSTVAGLAYQKGLFNLDEKLKDYIKDGKFSSDHNKEITWHHLLNQSSQWKGNLFGTFDWADRPPRNLTVGELKVQEIPKPGEAYEYNDVRVNLLSFSLLNVLKEPLPHILKKELMDPIGASSSWGWYGYEKSKILLNGEMVSSVSGGGHFGGGLFINSLDHARFGLLFLRNGKWKDKLLLSPEWIKLVQEPSENNESYGYMWWLNKGDRKWEGLSENIYYGAGFGGNFIVIIPDHNLVVVARWIDSLKIDHFIRKVVNAHTAR